MAGDEDQDGVLFGRASFEKCLEGVAQSGCGGLFIGEPEHVLNGQTSTARAENMFFKKRRIGVSELQPLLLRQPLIFRYSNQQRVSLPAGGSSGGRGGGRGGERLGELEDLAFDPDGVLPLVGEPLVIDEGIGEQFVFLEGGGAADERGLIGGIG